MSPQSGPRPRSRGTGRARLLDAARDVFTEKGYARGSIREIARRAEVTDMMIYKHFGSKAALFEAATIEPFSTYVAGYIEQWSSREPGSRAPREEAYSFLRGLYDVLHAERKILAVMMSVRQFDPEFAAGAGRVEEAFADVLALYEELVTVEAAKAGYQTFDAKTWVRLIFASVLSLAVHGDLLNSGQYMPPEHAITELTEMTVRAVEAG